MSFAGANGSVFEEVTLVIVESILANPMCTCFLEKKRKDFCLAPGREESVMVSSVKKKCVILIVTSLIISLLLLAGMPPAALASSKRATVAMNPKGATFSLAKTGNATKNGYGYTPSYFPNGNNYQVNKQYKEGNNYDSYNSYYWGDHQGNPGNSGYNAGFNRDNGSNSGNQKSSTKDTFRNEINKQVIGPGGADNGNSYYWGVDQGNSGNSGYNVCYNQNDYSNYGNQIND